MKDLLKLARTLLGMLPLRRLMADARECAMREKLVPEEGIEPFYEVSQKPARDANLACVPREIS